MRRQIHHEHSSRKGFRRLLVRRSGLSITINADGAIVDADVVTARPRAVAAWLPAERLARRGRTGY